MNKFLMLSLVFLNSAFASAHVCKASLGANFSNGQSAGPIVVRFQCENQPVQTLTFNSNQEAVDSFMAVQSVFLSRLPKVECVDKGTWNLTPEEPEYHICYYSK